MDEIRQLETDLCEALGIKTQWWVQPKGGDHGWATTEPGAWDRDLVSLEIRTPGIVSDPAAFGLVVEALGKRALGFDHEPVLLDNGAVHYAARVFEVGHPRSISYLYRPAEAFADWREAVCRAALAHLICPECPGGQRDHKLDCSRRLGRLGTLAATRTEGQR